MFLLGYGRAGFWRLVGAGVLFGGAVVGTHALLMRSINVGGTVTFNVPHGAGLGRSGDRGGHRAALVHGRHARAAPGARRAPPVPVWRSASRTMSARRRIEVNLGAGTAAGATGLGWMPVALLTLVLGTALIAMMWFFTVGTATRRDLHAIFDPLDDSGQIEPWMIEQVTARIALTTTARSRSSPMTHSRAAPNRPGDLRAGHLADRRLPSPVRCRAGELGPRPTPGITPVWRTMPVWGHPEMTPAPEPSRAWALRNAWRLGSRDRSNTVDLAATAATGICRRRHRRQACR